MSRFVNDGNKIIEGIDYLYIYIYNECKYKYKFFFIEYLWKLLRRAYIFISSPILEFIQLPIIMEEKTNLLSQQLRTIIREDDILCSIITDKYNKIKMILRYAYILDAYKIKENNQMINNDMNEGFNIKNENLFCLDLIEVKRVIRYQKEHKFAIETRRGVLYSFKCSNQQQFNQWVNDLKNMIKTQSFVDILFCIWYLVVFLH